MADNFAHCESTSYRKGAAKRKQLFARVKRADGEVPNFSIAARKALPKDTLRYLRDANWMDFELHALAVKLNAAAIQRESDRGALPVRSMLLPCAP